MIEIEYYNHVLLNLKVLKKCINFNSFIKREILKFKLY